MTTIPDPQIKDWKDGHAGGTRVNAAALEDMETRVTGYAKEVGESLALSLESATADIAAEVTARGAADALLAPLTSLAGLVTLNPSTSTRNVIQPTDPAVTALTLQLPVAGTASPLVVKNSAGSTFASIGATGALRGAYLQHASGVGATLHPAFDLGGFALITNSASNKGLVIRGASGQSARTFEAQDFNGVALTAIAGDGGLLSGSHENLARTGPYLSFGPTAILLSNRTAATNVPLIIRGMPAQSGDTVQVQDSAGAVQLRFNAAGILSVGSLAAGAITASNQIISSRPQATLSAFQTSYTGVTLAPFVINADGLQKWSDGTNASDTTLYRFAANVLRTDGIMVAASAVQSPNFQRAGAAGPFLSMGAASIVATNTGSVTNVPFTCRGMPAQTGNLQEWQNSAGGVVASILPSGSIFTNVISYATGGFDASAGAGKGLKLKSPDGLTTKTLTLDNTGALALI